MRIILSSFIIAILLASCQTTESFTFTEEEMKASGFSEKGWSILKDGKSIARIESMEWEYFEEERTRKFLLHFWITDIQIMKT